MAQPASLKQLEAKRKALVARNDSLREELAGRCEELGTASFWVSQGYELAERVFANRALVSLALNFFRNFGK